MRRIQPRYVVVFVALILLAIAAGLASFFILRGKRGGGGGGGGGTGTAGLEVYLAPMLRNSDLNAYYQHLEANGLVKTGQQRVLQCNFDNPAFNVAYQWRLPPGDMPLVAICVLTNGIDPDTERRLRLSDGYPQDTIVCQAEPAILLNY